MSLLGRFLARVGPINIGDGTLTGVVHAIMTPGEWLDDLVRDSETHSAWGKALDPDATPAVLLPWLAQFPGVQLLPSDTEQQQRDRITAAAGFRRGTPQAMIDEVTKTLTGSQFVSLLQQVGGNRWAMTIRTRTSETPNAAATYAAALRQKPAGINLTHVISNEPIVDEFTRAIDSIAAVAIDNLTVADVT